MTHSSCRGFSRLSGFSVLLPAVIFLGALGCSSVDDSETGQVQVAITSVPSNVNCVRITAQGARTVVSSFSVSPGQSSVLQMGGLPLGQDQFLGEAFPVQCDAVGPASVPGWASAAVTAQVSAGTITSVALVMHRNGSAAISVDFQDDTGSACATASDCAGASSPCQQVSCIAGTCAVAFAPAGTSLPGIAGDCMQTACDGQGSVVTAPDNTDLPQSGNPCIIGQCQAGVPVMLPRPAGAACGEGLVCDGIGQCVGCLSDADCGVATECAAFTCLSGQCSRNAAPAGTPTAQNFPGDCRRTVCDGTGTVITIADDTDLPVDGNVCTIDVCINGVPANLAAPAGTSCGLALSCDGTGSCLP